MEPHKQLKSQLNVHILNHYFVHIMQMELLIKILLPVVIHLPLMEMDTSLLWLEDNKFLNKM
jgi:hypothetical protein